MRRREFTPNDTRGVIRLLSFRYAGTARGRKPDPSCDRDPVHRRPDDGIRDHPREDPGRRTECHPDSRDGSVRSRGRWK